MNDLLKKERPVELEELFSFLSEMGVNPEYTNTDKHNFSRTISFTVYGVLYRVVWYKNQSTLYIGDNKRSACIPFRHVFYDNTFPLIGGNKSIAFSYVKFSKSSIYDREYPYEVFRIPLEIKEDS